MKRFRFVLVAVTLNFSAAARALAALTVALSVTAAADAQATGAFPFGVAAGDVTASQGVLWTKAARPGPITVEVAMAQDFATGVIRRTLDAVAERDATVKVDIGGLRPATRYYYRFRSGAAVSEIGTFVTAPARDASTDVVFAYSGDSDGTKVRGLPAFGPFPILGRVQAENPAFFVYLGDTIYSDSGLAAEPATTLDGYRRKYQENRRVVFLRSLLRSTSTIAVADDHEVMNDYDPPSVPPERLRAAWQAFREYWPVREGPGGRLYRGFRWGKELEVIVLDERSYRSPRVNRSAVCDNPPGSKTADIAPTLPPPLRQGFAAITPQLSLPAPVACLAALSDPSRTMLGEAQKAWLKQVLLGSDATWKVIINGVPIQELFALPYDRWEGYAAERVEILNFIRSSGIRNVVWLTTDTHATIVNDVRVSTYAPRFDPTGMMEIVTGPIGTNTFAREIAAFAGPAAVPAFLAFVGGPLPQGLGARCVEFDRFSYATVQVNAVAKTLRVTPKDTSGAPICTAPIVLRAVP